jgi:hypothetical protein
MADTPNRTTGTAPDQVAMQKQVADVAERTQAIFRAFMDRQSKGDVPPGFDHTTVSRAFRDWNAALMRDPGALMPGQYRLLVAHRPAVRGRTEAADGRDARTGRRPRERRQSLSRRGVEQGHGL